VHLVVLKDMKCQRQLTPNALAARIGWPLGVSGRRAMPDRASCNSRLRNMHMDMSHTFLLLRKNVGLIDRWAIAPLVVPMTDL
jgi:hypothetical protein